MLPLKIAFRFLRSSIGQTILIVVGISVGVSVQVFIGSLIGGLQQDLVNTTIGNSSQITITSEDDTAYIENYETIRNNLLNDVEGLETVSYSLDSPGTLIDGTVTEPILIRGMDFELSDGIYEIEDKVIDGRLPTSDNEIMLGANLFDDLGLSLGDTVEVSVPLIGNTSVDVVGVYDFKVASLNNLWVFTTLSSMQGIINENNVVSSIEMQVNDVFFAEDISIDVISSVNDSTLSVSNWIELNEDLLGGLKAQGSSSLMIQVAVTVSVVLGIASVLAITVIQKSRQIGILKAMGIKDKDASLIFLAQGFILGIFGAIGGISLGLLLSFGFSTFALDSAGEPVITLLIDPQFIAISALVAIFSASFASIIPARKSSKLSVMEVIKNG